VTFCKHQTIGKKRACQAIVILLLVFSLAAEAVTANPLPPWIISVDSPSNNKIYPSNNVELDFDPSQRSHSVNFTSFAYSVDGQAAEPTNGSTLLTGLPSGSHVLTIYGTFQLVGENKTYTHDIAIIYFSTVYSTQWVVFTLILLTFSVITGLPLIVKRKPIAARLRGKKTDKFWLGVVSLSFFTLLLALWVWASVSDYLYPHHSYGLVAYLPVEITFIIGFIVFAFIVLGLYLMYLGTEKTKQSR
jgi:hypothetical protein